MTGCGADIVFSDDFSDEMSVLVWEKVWPLLAPDSRIIHGTHCTDLLADVPQSHLNT